MEVCISYGRISQAQGESRGCESGKSRGTPHSCIKCLGPIIFSFKFDPFLFHIIFIKFLLRAKIAYMVVLHTSLCTIKYSSMMYCCSMLLLASRLSVSAPPNGSVAVFSLVNEQAFDWSIVCSDNGPSLSSWLV